MYICRSSLIVVLIILLTYCKCSNEYHARVNVRMLMIIGRTVLNYLMSERIIIFLDKSVNFKHNARTLFNVKLFYLIYKFHIFIQVIVISL